MHSMTAFGYPLQESFIADVEESSGIFRLKFPGIFSSSVNQAFHYGCYDPHHTVDGYTFPTLETLRGVWYTHLQRGADGVEYFNWNGEGKAELVEKYVKMYGTGPKRDNYVRHAKDDFTGVNDRDFLKK